jgi:CRISPR-associated protein Csx16
LFHRTGVAGPLVAHARRERMRQAEHTHASGKRNFPAFDPLVKAIEASLYEAIVRCREDVEQRLPPLALALDRIEQQVRPLAAIGLHDGAGQRALAALAQHYPALERYPEAAIVAREARVNRYAPSAEAVEVNAPMFDPAQRELGERRFFAMDPRARITADVRNDIGHGGFRKQPLPASALKSRVSELVDSITTPAVAPKKPVPSAARALFVSRHPGAQKWAREEDVTLDAVVEHLDIEHVNPGDTVIGSLPINLAAAVCARGACYLHLSLQLPATLRGKELSASELRALGATLIEYRVDEVNG